MKSAMKQYFDRLIDKWAAAGLGLPKAAWDPEVDPGLWQSPPDADEYAAWRPIEKTVVHDLAALAPELGPLHSSFSAYFNSWWFASLAGQFAGYGLTLEPVLPGKEIESFVRNARGRVQARGGLAPVPIGVEFNGLQIVVDNRTGVVAVDDWERDNLQTIAPTLEQLIRGIEP